MFQYLADRMLVEHFILNNVVQNLRPFALLNFRPPTKLIDNVLEATPYNKVVKAGRIHSKQK